MHAQAQPGSVQRVSLEGPPQGVGGQLEKPGATCLLWASRSQDWLCGLTKVTVKLMGS